MAPRILLVDDERRILNFVSRGLRREGFSVDVAAEGIEGLRLAVSEPYDLVILDLLRREADFGGGPVPLADREFLLLQELMRNRGRTVSKERLLSAVWGYHFDPGSNVVDVNVRRLRSKLGAEAVVTVRGQGYRVDVA